VRQDLSELLKYKRKETNRGKLSVPAYNRRNARKMKKKASRFGFATIKDYFLGDDRFRLRKRSEGWTEETIGQLDDNAAIEATYQPLRRAERVRKYGRTISVQEREGGAETVPFSERERHTEWSEESWESWRQHQWWKRR